MGRSSLRDLTAASDFLRWHRRVALPHRDGLRRLAGRRLRSRRRWSGLHWYVRRRTLAGDAHTVVPKVRLGRRQNHRALVDHGHGAVVWLLQRQPSKVPVSHSPGTLLPPGQETLHADWSHTIGQSWS